MKTPIKFYPDRGGPCPMSDLTADEFRENHPGLVWAYNPWSGRLRDPACILLDPAGKTLQPTIPSGGGAGAVPRDLFGSPAPVVRTNNIRPFTPAADMARVAQDIADKHAAEHAAQHTTLHAFAAAILDPEMYGHAVTAEIRNHARRALGMTAQEPV